MKRPVQEKIAVSKTRLARFLRHNVPRPRKFGRRTKICNRCGGTRRFISKYRLNICGRCFREVAKDLGFRKLK